MIATSTTLNSSIKEEDMKSLSDLFEEVEDESDECKKELLWQIFEKNPFGEFCVLMHLQYEDYLIGKTTKSVESEIRLIIQSHPSQKELFNFDLLYREIQNQVFGFSSNIIYESDKNVTDDWFHKLDLVSQIFGHPEYQNYIEGHATSEAFLKINSLRNSDPYLNFLIGRHIDYEKSNGVGSLRRKMVSRANEWKKSKKIEAFLHSLQ